MTNLDRLCRKINYKFKNPAYLKQALTHCSVGTNNNERLEFLGDSILSMVITNTLYQQFPKESEGQLSRLRAFLVKGETLANIAFEINLGDYLFLGQGELKSGGYRRASILADALEAIFAAIFIDGGIESSKQTILSLYKELLNDDTLKDNIKDAKTRLQEYLQSKKQLLPVYTLTKVSGDEHEQKFYITCTIPNTSTSSEGCGDNRRKAEQVAASKLLKILKK
jgi:ribonuclease III